VHFGFDRASFLAASPREIAGFIEQLELEDRRRMAPAALVCTVLANIHRDPTTKPEPWQISDFLPDPDAKTEQEEWIEFADKVRRGEEFKTPPAEMDSLKRMFEGMKKVKVQPKCPE
jgi:hypothetical protein